MPPEGISVICPESASGSRNAITAGCQLSPAESQGLPQGPAQHPTTAIIVCADADSGLRNSPLSCSTDYLFHSFFPHVTPAFAQVSSPATLILQRRVTAGGRWVEGSGSSHGWQQGTMLRLELLHLWYQGKGQCPRGETGVGCKCQTGMYEWESAAMPR